MEPRKPEFTKEQFNEHTLVSTMLAVLADLHARVETLQAEVAQLEADARYRAALGHGLARPAGSRPLTPQGSSEPPAGRCDALICVRRLIPFSGSSPLFFLLPLLFSSSLPPL